MHRIVLTMASILVSAIVGLSITTRAAADQKQSTAVFAGGCFWCVEADFEKLDGVFAAVSGYTGGVIDNPSYDQVTRGGTGHYEAVEVSYDPAKITYDALLDHFFRTIDPFDPAGQFCDRGESYRSAVFVASESERDAARAAAARVTAFHQTEVVTPVLELGAFWRAEEYHQDYYKKNPLRYSVYRTACGRDQRVKDIWSRRRP